MIINDIKLDDLDLMNDDYCFTLYGLFNFDKDIKSNEIYSDGQSFNSSKVNSKNIVLSGYIFTNNINKKMILNSILASNKLKQLVITTEELGELLCFVEVKNRATGDSSIAVSAQLLMLDPHIYELNPRTIYLGAVSNNGLSFPFTFPIAFGTITGGQGTITNAGNTTAYPLISIVGTCSNIVITNLTTGESMSIDTALDDSDTLVIDSRPDTRGIYLNNDKRMDLKNGSWLSCIPGDNVFNFQRTSLQTKQHCSIELQSRWI